jgi:ATP-binding cassette subfamily C protein LapB
MNNPNAQQFAWVMQRMAQMQGTRVDALSLNASLALLNHSAEPMKILAIICKQMNLAAPKRLKRPDRAQLPLICHTDAHGWGILSDQDAQGQWVVLTPQGKHAVAEDALHNATARLRLGGASLGVGLGLLKSKGEKDSFISHVQEALLSYRHELIEACVASAFIGFLALATSLFSMQVYDRVIPTRSEYTLVILSVGVLLSILIELAMKFARSHIMDYVIVGTDGRLSREIFHRLLQLRVDQIPMSVGSLAGQLRGYEQVRGFYTASTLFTLIDVPLALVFVVVIMLVASPWVAAVPFFYGLVALFIGLSMRKKIMAQAKEGAALSNMKTGLLVEAVEGIETIKAGSGGWKFLSRWMEVNGKTIESDLKMRSSTESVGYLSAGVQQISYASLVVVGSILVMQGHMTMGTLIASSILSGRILAPVMAIPGLMVQHAHAQAALEGLEKLYLLKTDHHGTDRAIAPSTIKGHFQLKDVKFAYGDNPAALVVPNLEIKADERIAILGPIGAGKSTLLRLLAGIYHPQEGRVMVDNLDLAHVNRQVVSQHIGYLQQDHRLFQGTLRENLLIGLPDPGDDALMSAMQRTGMAQFVAAHPKGLERPIMEGGKGLSGGQKQLVAFTRLVLCKPDVLLLDEPTASMDDDQEKRCMLQLAKHANAGKAMVLVTHKPSLLPLVTRIIVVSGNRIVMDGPRDLVLQKMRVGGNDTTLAPVAKAA